MTKPPIDQWAMLFAPPCSQPYAFGDTVLGIDANYVLPFRFESASEKPTFPGVAIESKNDGVQNCNDNGQIKHIISFSNCFLSVEESNKLKFILAMANFWRYPGLVASANSKGTMRLIWRQDQGQGLDTNPPYDSDRYCKSFSINAITGIGGNTSAGQNVLFVRPRTPVFKDNAKSGLNYRLMDISLEVVSPPSNLVPKTQWRYGS